MPAASSSAPIQADQGLLLGMPYTQSLHIPGQCCHPEVLSEFPILATAEMMTVVIVS
jgi:hypothetical protein